MKKTFKDSKHPPQMEHKKRRLVLIVGVILAVILFSSGLFSGLYVAKTVELRQQENLLSIE